MLIDFLTIFHLIKFLVDVILQIASHLPYNRNGFKFFTNAGGLGKADIKIILERAADIYKSFTDQGLMKSKRKASESIKRLDYMTVYTSDLVKAVRKAAENIGKFSETVTKPYSRIKFCYPWCETQIGKFGNATVSPSNISVLLH